MQRNIALIAIAVIGVSALIGSAAFTTGTVDRAANIDVVGDDAALVGLAPGDSSLVYYDGNNRLTIDFANVVADGVNADASFTLGSADAANTSYAFNITNNHDQPHDYSLSYVYDDPSIEGSPVTFDLYDDMGQAVSGGSANLAANEVAYVVITIDTSNVDATQDLSGTLTVTAN